MSIHGPRSRVDLALPVQVPLLELTPVLATLCQAGQQNGHRNGHGEGTPPAWSLARVGSAPLELTSTLAEAGILDGEVLHLVDVATWRSPAVTDVADAVSGALEDGPRWPGPVGAWVTALWAALCLIGVATVLVRLAGPGPSTAFLALFVAAGLACLGLIPHPVARSRPARSPLLAGAVAFTALAGWALAGGTGGWMGLSAAAAGAMIALVGVGAVEPAATGPALVAAALTVGAGAVARGTGPAQVAALVVVGAVIALRLWPPAVSRALSALVPATSVDHAEAAARRSRTMLASLTAGTSFLLLVAASALAASGGSFAIGLAAVAGLALLVRSETYRFVPEALPPALAAGGVFLVLGLTLMGGLAGPGDGTLLAGLLGLTAMCLVGLTLARPSVTAPRWATRLTWLLVDLAMGPLTLGTLGVFDLLLRLVHHLVH